MPNPCGEQIYSGYLCGSNYGNCGPLELAGLWELANSVVRNNGWSNEEIAAYTGNSAQSGYIGPYQSQILGFDLLASGFPTWWKGQAPSYWSVHDYDDPTSGKGTADLQWFLDQLKQYSSVWVTESAINLDDTTTSDQNGQSPCGTGESFGQCQNGNATDQQDGGNVWRNLASVSVYGIATTEVYWYQFLNDSTGWDSALSNLNETQAYTPYCTITGWGGACVPNSS